MRAAASEAKSSLIRALALVPLMTWAIAGMVGAGNTWVLWSSVWRDSWRPPNKGPIATFDTREQCERELERRISSSVAGGNIKYSKSTLIENGSGLIARLECLPDTVRPGGGKGE